MSSSAKRAIRFPARIAVASLAATAAVTGGLGTPAAAVSLPMALSNSYGPSGGGTKIVGTVAPVSSVPTPFPPAAVPAVQFQYWGTGATSCNPTFKADVAIAATATTTTAGVATVAPSQVKRITATKIAFEVPSAAFPTVQNPGGLVLLNNQTYSKWNVCVYDSNAVGTGALLSSATFTLVLRPTITDISPASSPAGGGQSITVSGTGFTAFGTPITANIDGVELDDIVVAANGSSFTATTGIHAAATGLSLDVVAPGGTVSSLDPDNNPVTNNPKPFSYTNGITVTPRTAPVSAVATIDVTGAGFSALQFETNGDPTTTKAHIFLVRGAYVAGSNRGVAECVVDMVISDTELVCTLDLTVNALSEADSTATGSPVAEGAYILTTVENGSSGAGVAAKPSIISSGATFTVSPY